MATKTWNGATAAYATDADWSPTGTPVAGRGFRATRLAGGGGLLLAAVADAKVGRVRLVRVEDQDLAIR